MPSMAVNSMSVQYSTGQGRKVSCCAVLERHLMLPHFAPLLPPHISSSFHLPPFYCAFLTLYLPLPSLYLPLPLPFLYTPPSICLLLSLSASLSPVSSSLRRLFPLFPPSSCLLYLPLPIQLKVLRSNAAEERKALEQRIRAEVDSQTEEREPRSSSSSSKGTGQISERERDRDRSEGKNGIERGDRERGDRERGDRERGDRESDIDYAGQEERDKRLQTEIRQLQLETVRTRIRAAVH